MSSHCGVGPRGIYEGKGFLVPMRGGESDRSDTDRQPRNRRIRLLQWLENTTTSQSTRQPPIAYTDVHTTRDREQATPQKLRQLRMRLKGNRTCQIHFAQHLSMHQQEITQDKHSYPGCSCSAPETVSTARSSSEVCKSHHARHFLRNTTQRQPPDFLPSTAPTDSHRT